MVGKKTKKMAEAYPHVPLHLRSLSTRRTLSLPPCHLRPKRWNAQNVQLWFPPPTSPAMSERSTTLTLGQRFTAMLLAPIRLQRAGMMSSPATRNRTAAGSGSYKYYQTGWLSMWGWCIDNSDLSGGRWRHALCAATWWVAPWNSTRNTASLGSSVLFVWKVSSLWSKKTCTFVVMKLSWSS